MVHDIQAIIQESANFITKHQLSSGSIPWYKGSITDPWDHVECAIALDLAGKHNEATKAYLWLRDIQNTDGSWWSGYLNGKPQDFTRDANYSSYIAVGLWCHYIITRDVDLLAQMWTTIEKALTFTLSLQQPTGEIYWAYDANSIAWRTAILAGSSCIWQSIKSSLGIAKVLGFDKPDWDLASKKLIKAIKQHPELFDKYGENKRDYAISWFYPVLAGVINGNEGQKHLSDQWENFVIDGWGCKCIAEAPWWVTVAETCELVISLIRIGEHERASQLLDWTLKLRDSDGGFWTGIKMPEQQIWPPDEKPTWVSAAFIIAASARIKAKDESISDFFVHSKY